MRSGNFSGVDRDGDGFVDNSHFYALASQGQLLFLRNWKGRRYSINSKRWQPISSIEDGDGFQVLFRGKRAGMHVSYS